MKSEDRAKVKPTPPTPKALRVRSHRIEIVALDYGNPDAPPLLLVHAMRDLAWSLNAPSHASRITHHASRIT